MLSNNLKELRHKEKMTQKEVSEILGITVRAYQNYESGRRTPSLKMALKLSNMFKCSVDDIFLLNNTA